jgi:endoglucanase
MRRRNHVIIPFALSTALAGCLGGAGAPDESEGVRDDSISQPACQVSYVIRDSWNGGFVADMAITNNTGSPYNGWKLTFAMPSGQKVQNLWNGKVTQSGANVSVLNESYNGSVPSGGSVSLGFVGNGAAAKPASFAVNGVTCNVPGGGGSSSSSTTSSSTTSSTAATTSSSTGTPTSPTGWLHTSGAQIVDSTNHPVRITGINWFGMETSTYAPHGLWARSMTSYLDQIKSLGYNTLRVPFASQMLDPGSTPNGIDFGKNPALVGLSPVQVLDRLVAEAGARGLKIILDRHRPDSNAQSALWYTAQYSEQRWIDDWKMLAQRYKNDPTVIGVDLHNEPHGAATWGSGDPATDWRLAAQKAGNAVLSVNPHLLIIVEGVEQADGTGYWWGGNLHAAGAKPVTLNVPNQLVYSIHDYPASIAAQPWFSDGSYPNNLPGVWDDRWGYLVKNGTAPVLIGELGTKYQTKTDQAWLGKLAQYIDQNNLSFTYWCLNPNSGDTGGILADDWVTVNQAKQAVIKPILAPLLP